MSSNHDNNGIETLVILVYDDTDLTCKSQHMPDARFSLPVLLSTDVSAPITLITAVYMHPLCVASCRRPLRIPPYVFFSSPAS